MALIKGVKGKKPQIHESCWLADNATVVGDVTMAANSNVWFNAVVRGDVCSIEMGENCNVQDGAVIHGTLNLSKTVLGNNVSIGHNAIVHGCIIEDNVLIGMGAIVMDNAVIKSGSMVAAGAVVLANTVVEPNSLYAGTPAKKVKEIDARLRQVIDKTPEHYIMYASWIED
ncbi:gamma carbonic anhydrase family protein [Roseivirga sp.]|uniref:gamma carbonic anhydrase family protein n=1 Tax=Roseivirga sp. TaxID=1964215 RepID=UPI003B51EE9B